MAVTELLAQSLEWCFLTAPKMHFVIPSIAFWVIEKGSSAARLCTHWRKCERLRGRFEEATHGPRTVPGGADCYRELPDPVVFVNNGPGQIQLGC